jgi:photosystem II stability/assembly factor-like uncharacterized protein
MRRSHLILNGFRGLALALLPAACGLLAACNGPAATPLPSASPVTAVPTTDVVTLTSTLIPSPTPLPPNLPVVASPALARLDFQDASRGWGIAVNDRGYIVRTVDGGRTWLNATPPGLDSLGLSARLFVLDSLRVWALLPGSDFYSASLYHTTDGGLSWTSSQVPFGSAELQFLDDSTGRALADRGAGAGSNAVGLYQTSDAGVTWTYLFHDDPTEPGASNSLPLEGIKNGMTFVTPGDGWVSGSLPVSGNIYLYATHDGGISWSHPDLSLPFGSEAALTMTHPPLFFGQEGLLPLTLNLPDSTGLLFYASHDGGLSWRTEARTPVWPGRYSFADASHGWVWDGIDPIRMTVDGGVTWQDLPASLSPAGGLSQIQFVPDGPGRFAGWALTGLDENNHARLFKTEDNGATWSPLTP